MIGVATDNNLRRVVRLVAVLNLAYFGIEFAVARAIGSVSLFSDSAIMPAITPSLCRAARGMLGWTQDELASKARVGLNTLRNFEAGRSAPMTNNLAAIQTAIEEAGIELIPENGGGAGLRMRKAAK